MMEARQVDMMTQLEMLGNSKTPKPTLILTLDPSVLTLIFYDS